MVKEVDLGGSTGLEKVNCPLGFSGMVGCPIRHERLARPVRPYHIRTAAEMPFRLIPMGDSNPEQSELV